MGVVKTNSFYQNYMVTPLTVAIVKVLPSLYSSSLFDIFVQLIGHVFLVAIGGNL